MTDLLVVYGYSFDIGLKGLSENWVKRLQHNQLASWYCWEQSYYVFDLGQGVGISYGK